LVPKTYSSSKILLEINEHIKTHFCWTYTFCEMHQTYELFIFSFWITCAFILVIWNVVLKCCVISSSIVMIESSHYIVSSHEHPFSYICEQTNFTSNWVHIDYKVEEKENENTYQVLSINGFYITFEASNFKNLHVFKAIN
jgi:hypothetical protein